MLVPYASDFYYQSRATIAIVRPDVGNPLSAIRLDANWGLTSALLDSIAPMFARREVAFVPFAGTEDLSRSHFEAQDDIESGQAALDRCDFRCGFLARLIHGSDWRAANGVHRRVAAGLPGGRATFRMSRCRAR